MKVKVFEKTEGCFPQQFEIGDWYDLVTAKDIKLFAPVATALKYSTKKNPVTEEEKLKYKRDVVFQYTLIPLGVCIELPKYYEAVVIPRSSTFGKYGLIQTNSVGLIDNSYSSEKDEWKFPVMATRDVVIPKGTRICQFRIQLNQKANVRQKLKWLFSGSVKLVKVEHLDNEPRGGFGEGTDKKSGLKL
jgi:dUTP pyrophosphatase